MAVEQPISAERLLLLNEAFVTATGCEVAPIVAIDGRAVGNGGVGPMTRKLIDDFRKLTRDVRSTTRGGDGALTIRTAAGLVGSVDLDGGY